jgi:hypothetical protein
LFESSVFSELTSLPIRRFETDTNERFVKEMIHLWWKYQAMMPINEMGRYLSKLIRIQSIVAYYPNKYPNIQVFQSKDVQLINDSIVQNRNIAAHISIELNISVIQCISRITKTNLVKRSSNGNSDSIYRTRCYC